MDKKRHLYGRLQENRFCVHPEEFRQIFLLFASNIPSVCLLRRFYTYQADLYVFYRCYPASGRKTVAEQTQNSRRTTESTQELYRNTRDEVNKMNIDRNNIKIRKL